MLSPSQFSPQAWDDMRDIVAYIASDNPDAAARFVPALEATYAQLVAMPGMGSVRQFRRTDLQGVRMVPVTGFAQYLMFYTALRTHVKVIRILHAARDFPTIFGG
jgi:toxin ParE1/3/4